MHGVSFVVCICGSIKMDTLDMATNKEDCSFATDDLDALLVVCNKSVLDLREG
jgi:hypothetical protein